MLCLAIRVYPKGGDQATPTVRIPLAIVATIAKVMPPSVKEKLGRHGIDVEQLLQATSTNLGPGVLVDIADEDDRIVIAIETISSDPPRQLTDAAGRR